MRFQGKIFEFDFSSIFIDPPDSGEAEGERFAVVVSVEELNQKLESVVVAPTSASDVGKKSDHFHNVPVVPGKDATGIPKKCVIQMHQMYSLNKNRLGRKPIGEILRQEVIYEIAEAGASVLGYPDFRLFIPAPE